MLGQSYKGQDSFHSQSASLYINSIESQVVESVLSRRPRYPAGSWITKRTYTARHTQDLYFSKVTRVSPTTKPPSEVDQTGMSLSNLHESDYLFVEDQCKQTIPQQSVAVPQHVTCSLTMTNFLFLWPSKRSGIHTSGK